METVSVKQVAAGGYITLMKFLGLEDSDLLLGQLFNKWDLPISHAEHSLISKCETQNAYIVFLIFKHLSFAIAHFICLFSDYSSNLNQLQYCTAFYQSVGS